LNELIHPFNFTLKNGRILAKNISTWNDEWKYGKERDYWKKRINNQGHKQVNPILPLAFWVVAFCLKRCSCSLTVQRQRT
jgi:hypothetical protein